VTEILLAVAIFTGVILSLVALLLVARDRLVAAGDVQIVINGDRDRAIRTHAGDTLLSTLAAEQIIVPSACGGKGTCGVCKVKVTSGGGAPLPTEASLVTRREARDGVRLSCQLKVKQDLEIVVPAAVFDARRWSCRVRSNANVATFIKELVLEIPDGESVPFRAGGYIQLQAPPHTLRYRDFEIEAEYREDWDRFGMWQHVSEVAEPTSRAYSMANYPGEGAIIKLNVRVSPPPRDAPAGTPPGIVSSYVFGLKPGDEVTISGPFGEFFARETDAEMMFIGGGAGMAPLRSHIFDQLLRLQTRRKITFWYGARSLREAFYREDFDRLAAEHDNFRWCLALSDPQPEDHWEGPTGFIHAVALEQYLEQHEAPEDIEFYLCGPPMMLRACLEMLAELGVEPGNISFDDFG
jgi:Na+-transporting NADH:ubiquinone oxidoreductase subunit F